MDRLTSILFEVNTDQADMFTGSIHVDAQAPALDERLLVLRDLVSLRKIGVKIVLARKPADRRDLPLHGQARADGELHRLAVEHW